MSAEPRPAYPSSSAVGTDVGVTRTRPDSAGQPSRRRRFVVSDIHGHPEGLLAALQEKGLADQNEAWAGGTAQLWVLGDYFDRGPDGVGVVDLLIRLAAEAEAAGGQVSALLGNHEVLTLGKHRFGVTPIQTPQGERSFAASWARNDGQATDQQRLSARHLSWLTELPGIALVDEHLLVHSDVDSYREWGGTVQEVNDQLRRVLHTSDPEELWGLWSALTKRSGFQGLEGVDTAQGMLEQFGGSHIFHGHSIIGEDEGWPASVTKEPKHYAEDLVTAIDGGLFLGGPCLVIEF